MTLVRTLAWESVLPAASLRSGLYQWFAIQRGEADCHTNATREKHSDARFTRDIQGLTVTRSLLVVTSVT